MITEVSADVAGRAAAHRALGDPSRLAIFDALVLSDRMPGELRAATGLDWNLLGFHLRTLENAGVVRRRVSDGDRRRRYVRLRPGALDRLGVTPELAGIGSPLFVCTHNSARSQFAAALWRKVSGRSAASAGSRPAAAVHPLAVEVAERHGVDLTRARPRGYDEIGTQPDLVVSVCDRAFEGGVPFDAPRLHWSVPDPSGGERPAFEAAFADIAERLARLARVAA
jgi:protein-tyrosine-phosphatase/DNA-binding HxlR family transcriptional regulator